MWGKRVNGNKAKELVKQGALLVDTRNPVAFRDGTIPGAKNIPINNISQLLAYDKKINIILFGENDCDNNLLLMLKYASQIFPTVYYLNSKDDWK
ncbi:MAG: rhodanese-like domain-containing protein [Nitrososphaeraceae archaeon]